MKSLADADPDMDIPDIESLGNDALDTKLRQFDADRVKRRLEGLAGSVDAMREIFGDMGNPNAPMSQIIDGLNALTQGGLASMSASELERMVRTTKSVAQLSGVGMDAMMALTAQAGQIGDKLGLHRSLAPVSAQQGALAGRASADQGWAGTFGSARPEEVMVAVTKAREQGFSSRFAQGLGSLMRAREELTDTGEFKAGSRAEKLYQAIQRGDDTFEGRNMSSLLDNRARMREILDDDSGLNANSVNQWGDFLTDPFGNQRYLSESPEAGAILGMAQSQEAGEKVMHPAVGIALGTNLRVLGESDPAFADQKRQNEVIQNVALPLSQNIWRNATAEDMKDGASWRAFVDREARPLLEAEGLTDEQIDTMMPALAAGIKTQGHRSAQRQGYQNLQQTIQMFGGQAVKQQQRNNLIAQQDAEVASSLAPLKAVEPLRRFMDILKKGDQPLAHAVGEFLGGVPAEDFKEPLQEAFDAMRTARRRLDEAETDEDRTNAQEELRVAETKIATLRAAAPEEDANIRRVQEFVRGDKSVGDIVGDIVGDDDTRTPAEIKAAEDATAASTAADKVAAAADTKAADTATKAATAAEAVTTATSAKTAADEALSAATATAVTTSDAADKAATAAAAAPGDAELAAAATATKKTADDAAAKVVTATATADAAAEEVRTATAAKTVADNANTDATTKAADAKKTADSARQKADDAPGGDIRPQIEAAFNEMQAARGRLKAAETPEERAVAQAQLDAAQTRVEKILPMLPQEVRTKLSGIMEAIADPDADPTEAVVSAALADVGDPKLREGLVEALEEVARHEATLEELKDPEGRYYKDGQLTEEGQDVRRTALEGLRGSTNRASTISKALGDRFAATAVDTEQISAVEGQVGAIAEKLIPKLDEFGEETGEFVYQKAASPRARERVNRQYKAGSKSIAALANQFYGDENSMRRLGEGGLDLIESMEADQLEFDRLVRASGDDADALLSGGGSVEKLRDLVGKAGVENVDELMELDDAALKKLGTSREKLEELKGRSADAETARGLYARIGEQSKEVGRRFSDKDISGMTSEERTRFKEKLRGFRAGEDYRRKDVAKTIAQMAGMDPDKLKEEELNDLMEQVGKGSNLREIEVAAESAEKLKDLVGKADVESVDALMELDEAKLTELGTSKEELEELKSRSGALLGLGTGEFQGVAGAEAALDEMGRDADFLAKQEGEESDWGPLLKGLERLLGNIRIDVAKLYIEGEGGKWVPGAGPDDTPVPDG
jgi:hypothetical protein